MLRAAEVMECSICGQLVSRRNWQRHARRNHGFGVQPSTVNQHVRAADAGGRAEEFPTTASLMAAVSAFVRRMDVGELTEVGAAACIRESCPSLTVRDSRCVAIGASIAAGIMSRESAVFLEGQSSVNPPVRAVAEVAGAVLGRWRSAVLSGCPVIAARPVTTAVAGPTTRRAVLSPVRLSELRMQLAQVTSAVQGTGVSPGGPTVTFVPREGTPVVGPDQAVVTPGGISAGFLVPVSAPHGQQPCPEGVPVCGTPVNDVAGSASSLPVAAVVGVPARDGSSSPTDTELFGNFDVRGFLARLSPGGARLGPPRPRTNSYNGETGNVVEVGEGSLTAPEIELSAPDDDDLIIVEITEPSGVVPPTGAQRQPAADSGNHDVASVGDRRTVISPPRSGSRASSGSSRSRRQRQQRDQGCPPDDSRRGGSSDRRRRSPPARRR